MLYFPDHMNQDEMRICSRLLTAILDPAPVQLFVRVHDGEDWATDWTRDRETIQKETAATDMTRWFVMDVDKDTGACARLGSFLLIHGNGEEVISDTSFNPRQEGAEDMIQALFEYAIQS